MNLEESIKLTVESFGVKLYDIIKTKENERDIFRVYITSEDGITLDKCADISKLISPILDIYEPMQGEYNLEISSPGLERKLKKVEHFKASIGENVKIKDIANEKYKGKIISADDNGVIINSKSGDKNIIYDSILSASTYIKW